MNYAIFCYGEDHQCLQLCVEQIRRVDCNAKIHLFDDGSAPLEPEQVPAGEDISYKITYFARRGNLNGLECVRGLLGCMLDMGGLAAIGVDYLQLMRSTSRQAANSREREVAEISAGLKALAKELKVPVVVLAQLNRGPETRTGNSVGVPRMSDLRESGSIEQDADMIGLLYRSDYYAEDEGQRQQLAGQANLHVAKNRNGPTGDVPLRFEAELMRFSTREPLPSTKQ